MSQHIKLIEAQPAEFDLALKILRTAAQNLLDKGINQWSYWIEPPVERLSWLQNGMDSHEVHFIYHQQEIAGMVRIMHEDLKYWGAQPEPALYIHSLVVLPAYHGRNIGATVIDKIANKARAKDINLLRLDCDSSNKRLCAYYENLNFKKVDQREMMYSINNFYELTL